MTHHHNDHSSDPRSGNVGKRAGHRCLLHGSIISCLLAAAVLSIGCAHVRYPFYMGRIPDLAATHGAQPMGGESASHIEGENISLGVDIGTPRGYKFAQGPVDWPSTIIHMVLFTPLYAAFGPVRQNRDPGFDDVLQHRIAESPFDHRRDLESKLTQGLKEAGFRVPGLERIDQRRLFPIHMLRTTDIRDFGDDMRTKGVLPVTLVIPDEPMGFEGADRLVFVTVRYELMGGSGWRSRARLHTQVAMAFCSRENWEAFCEKADGIRKEIDVFPRRKRGSWMEFPSWIAAFDRMKAAWDLSVEHKLLQGFEITVFSIPPSERMRKSDWASPGNNLQDELRRMNNEIAGRVITMLNPREG